MPPALVGGPWGLAEITQVPGRWGGPQQALHHHHHHSACNCYLGTKGAIKRQAEQLALWMCLLPSLSPNCGLSCPQKEPGKGQFSATVLREGTK